MSPVISHVLYEPASLGMFQCRLQRILCDFEVIMFFRKDPPQTERRKASRGSANQNGAGFRRCILSHVYGPIGTMLWTVKLEP